LDAIASSAQLLLSSLERPISETDEDEGHDLLRASVLALDVVIEVLHLGEHEEL
jgi:hypothetical protein